MRRWILALVLVGVGCDTAPEPTAIQRGERVFRPVAERLGQAIAADLRKLDAAAFDKYVKESGGKDENDLARFVATQTLMHYAEALSMSSSKEADLKAGKYDDAMNQRRINAAIGTFTTAKLTVPQVCQVLLQKYNAGEWRSGLELEFSARILEHEVLLPKGR